MSADSGLDVDDVDAFGYYVIDPTQEAPAFLAVHYTLLLEVFPTTFLHGFPEQHDYRWRVSFWQDKETRLSRDLHFSLSESSCSSLLHALDFTHLYPRKVASCFLLVELIHRASGAPLSLASKSLRLSTTRMTRVLLCKEDMFGARLSFVSTFSQATQWRCKSREIVFHSNDLVAEQVHFMHVDNLQMAPDLLELSSSERILVNATCVASMPSAPQKTPSFLGEKTGAMSFDWITSSEFSFQAASEIKVSVIGMNTNSSSSSSSSSGGTVSSVIGIRYAELCCGSFVPSSSSSIVSREVCLYTHPTAVIVGDESNGLEKTLVGKITITLAGNDEQNGKNVLANVLKSSSALPVWVWEADDALFRELGSEEAISCLAACARRVAFGSPLAKKIVLSPTSKQQQQPQSPFSPSGRSEEENTELIMHVVSKLALALSSHHKLGDPASFAEQASMVDKFGATPILWTYFQFWLGSALVNKLIAGASSSEATCVDSTTTSASGVRVPSQELSAVEVDSIRGACWSLRVLSYSGHIERIHGHFLSPPSLIEKQDHITTQGIAEDLLHTILAFAGNSNSTQTESLVQNASMLLPLVGDLSLEVCAATAVLATIAAPCSSSSSSSSSSFSSSSSSNSSFLSSFLSICLLHQPLGLSMFKKALPLSWSRSSAVRSPITCHDLLSGAMLEVTKACKGAKECSSIELSSLYSLLTTLTKLLFSTPSPSSQAPLALSLSSSTPLLSTQLLSSPSPAIMPPSGARRKKTSANGKVTVTSHLLSMLEKQQQQDAEESPKRLALLFLGERCSFLDSLLLCTKAISTTMAASQLLDQLLDTLPPFPLSAEFQEGGVAQSIVLLVARVAAAIDVYWQSSTPAFSSFALHLSLLSEFVHFFFSRITTDETLCEAEVASFSLSLSSSLGVANTTTHNTISCWLGLRQQLQAACFGVLRAVIKLRMLQGDDDETAGREREDSQLVWLIRDLTELGPLVTTRPDLAVLCLPSTEADARRVMFDLFATALDVPGRTNKLNLLSACINTMHLVPFENLESFLQSLVDGSVLRSFRNSSGNFNAPPLILSLLQVEDSQNLFDSNSPDECAHVLHCLMHILSDPRSTGDASSSSSSSSSTLQSPLPPTQITFMRERFRRRLVAIKLYVSSAEKKRTEYNTLATAAALSTLLQLSSSSTSIKQQEAIVTEITALVPCSTFAGSHGAGQALTISSILSSLENLPDPRYHHHYLESAHKASRLALGMMLQTGEWEAGVTFVKQLLKQNNENVAVNKKRQKAISLELTGVQEKLMQRLVHDGDLRPLPLHYAVRFTTSPWGIVDALSHEARAYKEGDEGKGGQDVEEDVWLLLRFDASAFCACAEEFASIDTSPGSCTLPGPCSVSIQRALLKAFPNFTLAPSTTLAEPECIGTKRPRIIQVFQAFFAKPNGEEEHDAVDDNEDVGNKSTDDGGGEGGGDAHSHTITRMDTTLSLSATVVGEEDEYEQSAVFRAHDGLRRGGNSDAAPLGIWERAMHAEVFHIFTCISSEAGGGSSGEESVVRFTLTCRSGLEGDGSSGSIRSSKLDKIQSHLVPANLLFVTGKKKVTAFDAGLSVIRIQQITLERLYAALKRVAAQGPSELASSSSSHIEHKNIMSTHAIMSACVIAVCNMYVTPSCLCVGIHNSLCLLAGESDRLETRWQKQRKQLKKVQMRMKSEYEAQVREAELHGFEMPEEPPAFDLSELEAEHLEAKQSLMRLTARRDRCLDLISGILLDLRVCIKSWVSSLSFARSTAEREHEKLVWTQVVLWLEANTEEQLNLFTPNN